VYSFRQTWGCASKLAQEENMSAYATIETQYKDRECLVAALNEMGYTNVEVHEEAQALYGYHGDRREEKANVIVRRQYVGSAANDLGFVRTPAGTYSAIISQFDSGKHNTKWLDGLKRNYTEKVTVKEAKRQGLKPYKRQIVNGKLVMQYLKA
jgi:SRSO17 transposase